MAASKSLFYYEFYFKGKLKRRFLRWQTAVMFAAHIVYVKKEKIDNENWVLKITKRKKLSTGRKATKIKEFEKCQ